MQRREHMTPAYIHIPKQTATPLEHAVSGEEVRTSLGTFFLSRNVMHGNHLHGRSRIRDLAYVSMEALGFLAGPQMTQGMPLSDGLFLDSETTGLSGGTGTFPFLVGLGWFEGDTLITSQLFARDFSEEGPMLRYLSEIALGKRFLVTFNGKAYDLNLLAARFILNRCRDTISSMPHVDLLHPSRRLLAHRLENARLTTIERDVLGVERDGDIPGLEIPRRYFDWLRLRDGRLMEGVFAHNKLDVISMASLVKYLSDLIEDGQVATQRHDGDLLRLAGLMHERGQFEKSGTMLQTLTSSHHTDIATSARQALSLIYKRNQLWDAAVELWQNILAGDPHNFFAVEELAKYYEHHTHEYEKASELVREFLKEPECLSKAERMSAEYRLRRLFHKAPSV